MKSFHRRTARPAPVPHETPAPAVDRHGLQRVDSLLVAQGLAPSRTVAQRMIAAGRVSMAGQPVAKASLELPGDAPLSITPDDDDRFVSRGGLKLAAALTRTGLSVAGAAALDVGQSTGGFTDCLLQAGAARVIGVEVGHEQLHPRLRHDTRVVCIEGLNARNLDRAELGEHMPTAGFDLIVCDASFISLTLLLPRWPALLAPGGSVLALVKPQFETDGPEALGKGGVVRSASAHAAIERRIREAATASGFAVRDWFDSPITGGGVGKIAGNREFLIWMQHDNHDPH
ncbi:MAG: TlyA family RNA methyltransferase [Rhodocyclales bacterium]|nr:TlyA family RNA methyltransferase [Rhodocyclales bacterium]